ncbi:MAG TPA: hypothetical protein VHJ17_12295 [Thermomonospora sp.]|nr:hypothetical protein [Thermomonospora sp.]
MRVPGFTSAFAGRRNLFVTSGALVLGAVSVLYTTSGRWDFVGFSIPQGWMIGSVLFWGLTFEPSRNDRRDRVARWLLWSTAPALAAQQVAYVLDGQRWDGAYLIGWLSLLIGLELAVGARARAQQALRRLADRRALEITAEQHTTLVRDLDRAGDRWAVAGACGVAVAVTLTWPRAGDVPARWHDWSFGPAVTDQILLVVAAATAGGWLGRMAAYGRLGGFLARRALTIRVIAGHPDGAGGLKPVGDLYLYQSLVASLPAIFAAVWSLLVSLGRANPALGRYVPYLDQYLWMLAVAIVFQVLVFLLPMLSTHMIMLRYKERVFLAEADRLSLDIEAAQAALNSGDAGEQELATIRLGHLNERYRALEKAPTWPIDPSIRRRFTLRNLGLLIPFVSSLVGATEAWRTFSTEIGRLLTS